VTQPVTKPVLTSIPVSAVSRILKLSSLVFVIALGLLFALANMPGLEWPALLFLDLLFAPFGTPVVMASPEMRMLAAIGGGITVGWGVMIWLIADRLLPRDPDLARTILLPGIVVWYVVDTASSLLAGSVINAVLNTVLLALFALPLLAMKKGDSA
jgi:hypothetical protein